MRLSGSFPSADATIIQTAIESLTSLHNTDWEVRINPNDGLPESIPPTRWTANANPAAITTTEGYDWQSPLTLHTTDRAHLRAQPFVTVRGSTDKGPAA
jgi:hypothetical protein